MSIGKSYVPGSKTTYNTSGNTDKHSNYRALSNQEKIKYLAQAINEGSRDDIRATIFDMYPGWQTRQNNRNMDVIDALMKKGATGEDIATYLTNSGFLDKSTSGKDIKVEDALNWFDSNYTTNSDGTVTKTDTITNSDGTITNNNGTVTKTNTSAQDSGIDYYKSLVDKTLMTDPNSSAANQYRQNMYGAINQYQQASEASLASAELDAYRQLGQTQLQLENQIASQRMQALKSGVTSAQLASQELANIFAAQSAAQQVAQNVLQQKTNIADTYNQQRAGVESNLYNMISNNQVNAANAYAQLGAAQASYNSYVNQPYAQYQALAQTYNKYGANTFKNMMNYQQ